MRGYWNVEDTGRYSRERDVIQQTLAHQELVEAEGVDLARRTLQQPRWLRNLYLNKLGTILIVVGSFCTTLGMTFRVAWGLQEDK